MKEPPPNNEDNSIKEKNNDEVINDKVINDEVINDEVINDKVINDKVINDKVINEEEKKEEIILDHLNVNYYESARTIIGSYYTNCEILRMVRHQLESMNHFINYQMQATINMFNNRVVKSEKDYNQDTGNSNLIVNYSIMNLKFYQPQIYENNGSTKITTPNDARLRNFTYAAKTTVDILVKITHRYESNDEPKIIEYTIPSVKFIDMPIMLQSTNCIITQYKEQSRVLVDECPKDPGGYFIIKGTEKVVLAQERAAENKIYVFPAKNMPKWTWYAELKSVPDSKCISPKQIELRISSKKNIYGNSIYVVIPRLKIKTQIELFVLFRALGITTDKEICEYIVLDVNDSKQKEVFKYLEASMYDASKYNKSAKTCQEDAIQHVMTMVSYNIYQNQKVNTKQNYSYVDIFTEEVLSSLNYYGNKFITQTKEVIYSVYILKLIKQRKSYNTKNQCKKREYTMDIFENEIFPHCKTRIQKLYMLGLMVNRLIQTALGYIEPTDRDSYINKRVELTGTLINNLFRNLYSRFIKDFDKKILKEINTGAWTDPQYIINVSNVHKLFSPNSVDSGIKTALSTGDFSVKMSQSSGQSKVGVAQVLSRLNYISILSHIRRINTPIDKTGELIAPRKLHPTTYGFLCPVETPEGQSVGGVKQISILTHITIPTQSAFLYEYLQEYIISVDDVVNSKELSNKVKVIINGAWIGCAKEPINLYNRLKQNKFMGIINTYTSIVFDYKNLELRICNDGGRLTRPLLKVSNNRALITKQMIDDLKTNNLSWYDLLVSNDKINNNGTIESVIEYIDVDEQSYSMIALKNKDNMYIHELNVQTKKNAILPNYTHCEIHSSTILGVLSSCIPFPQFNQAPRNTYQCAMAKQAMGKSSSQYNKRMDKTSYILENPSKALIDTNIMTQLKLNELPAGLQIHVAIMSYTGYNQEDSVLVNQGSIDRGMFTSTIYHTEKDEDKNIIRDEIIRCKPDIANTRNIKMGNYNKIDTDGFIPVNMLVENKDIYIAKKIPIKENKNDPTKVLKYDDQSKRFRTSEETYIDLNYTNRNGDGCNFAKTRTRTFRKLHIGDKLVSRSAQKGTCGNIIPECDMPYTASGQRPDLILNPHAIPSRMTIAQLAESLFGSLLLFLGQFGDGTCCGNITIDNIREALSKCGFESNGNVIMYSGFTGEQIETPIFMGTTYYQRLKHMVNDKEHSRSTGQMVNLTRQPGEGRSREGGFRIGEMERDVFIAHGISAFCVDRMYYASDKYQVHVCKQCGLIATYNDGSFNKNRALPNFTIHKCRSCNNQTDFTCINIPYAEKLLTQELLAMNISTRYITE